MRCKFCYDSPERALRYCACAVGLRCDEPELLIRCPICTDCGPLQRAIAEEYVEGDGRDSASLPAIYDLQQGAD